jgi:hypothetical protein
MGLSCSDSRLAYSENQVGIETTASLFVGSGKVKDSSMRADEIGSQLARELKHAYQYRNGRWLHRQPHGWSYTSVPRLAIWNAMVSRKRAGVVPSKSLADDIQRYLEVVLDQRTQFAER